ncbi:hypothetical protein ACRRTK_015069 [Alexandromys fortis]
MQVIMEHLDALHSFVQNFTLFRNEKGIKIVKGIELCKSFSFAKKVICNGILQCPQIR